MKEGNNILRRLSWFFALLSWLVPAGFFSWQWWQFGRTISSDTPEQFYTWLVTSLFADFTIAGGIAIIAVVLGIGALLKLSESDNYNPLLRILEIVVLAIPLLVCLFMMGTLLVHG